MKYPQYMDGAIAGSAPILGVSGLTPESDPYAFAAQETRDASPEVGVDNEYCVYNLHHGWNNILSMTETETGRESLADIFNLCSTVVSDRIVIH